MSWSAAAAGKKRWSKSKTACLPPPLAPSTHHNVLKNSYCPTAPWISEMRATVGWKEPEASSSRAGARANVLRDEAAKKFSEEARKMVEMGQNKKEAS